MKKKTLFVVLLGLGVAAFIGCQSTKNPSEANVAVSKADAQRIALAQVPNGTIKEGELEKENGRMIWSFDIAMAGSSNIKEVQVDANSGKVVSLTTETAADEAKEAAKEKKSKERGEDEKDEKK